MYKYDLLRKPAFHSEIFAKAVIYQFVIFSRGGSMQLGCSNDSYEKKNLLVFCLLKFDEMLKN